MFHTFSSPLLAKVHYAALFGYNRVLQRVFEAPTGKVALRVEMPGAVPQDYTYGRLQRDVVQMADRLVSRREAVCAARGERSLAWVQASKPPEVRSLFAQGERTPSCDYMQDTGYYTASLMAGPGYTYVVSLLTCWALNIMATPMSVSQRYNDELMYVLKHSGSRMILGETALVKRVLPSEFGHFYVGQGREESAMGRLDGGINSERTCALDSVVDVESLIDENNIRQSSHFCREGSMGRISTEVGHRLCGKSSAGLVEASASLEIEILPPCDHARALLDTAEDVMARLRLEKQRAKEREISRLEHILATHSAGRYPQTSNASSSLSFDSENLEELNPLFRRWYEEPSSRPQPYDDCLMIYTSGTTTRPKGAVHTHASVSNMVSVLQTAWSWSSEDSILHVLPVHHVHGLVNILLCPLAKHARCVLTPFDTPERVAHRLERGNLSLFVGTPEVYASLLDAVHLHFSPVERSGLRKSCCESLRLMASTGNVAVPVSTRLELERCFGHVLLEGYATGEVGMALSQPLRPVDERIPGTVGSPLPAVRALVYQSTARGPAANEEGYDRSGVLAIASESLFDRYWNNPTATKQKLCTSEDGMRYFVTCDAVTIGDANMAASGVRACSLPLVFTLR